ncbi:MAG: DUF3499 family protein [Actinomycetota bacterium]
MRTGCADPAEATVGLLYRDREVMIVDLVAERDPNLLELCGPHTDRLSPPVGWRVTDNRSGAASSA